MHAQEYEKYEWKSYKEFFPTSYKNPHVNDNIFIPTTWRRNAINTDMVEIITLPHSTYGI